MLVSAIIRVTFYLAISFFILLATEKTASENLKKFGYVIAVLFWIGAALVFSKGLASFYVRNCPMKSRPAMMMQHKQMMPAPEPNKPMMQ